MKELMRKQKKLKNLLVISSGFPDKNDKHYISIFVKEQVLALSKHFDNIYVFAPYPHNPKLITNLSGLPPSGDFKNYHQKNVHVFFPKYFDMPGKLSDGLRARRWLQMVTRIIDDGKIKFDAIHGHFTYPGGKVAQLLAMRYDKPYFVSVHENQDWLKRELSSPLKKRTDEIWHNARKVFFVNKIEGDKLHREYGNIEWLPNGVDTKRFRPMDMIKARHKLNLSLDKTILLSVGSLIPIKNYQLLISTVAKLAKRRPNIYCVIIGSGKERSSLIQLAKELSLQDNVIIVPQLPNNQLPQWYNASNIYCVSSKRESFGITQLEAMACGRPVVATRNGNSEFLIPSNSGVIVSDNTVQKYSIAITRALKKKWHHDSIRKYSNIFDIDAIAKKLLIFINH